jgi:hypothetical protein
VKIHTKKKLYRRMLKEAAKAGLAPRADGIMVQRSQLQDNAMKRDFYPQSGK